MKLLIPLFFAFAHGSCYDYEYYDPDTGSSIPGNACARQAAAAAAGTTAGAVVGAPVVASQTFGAPVATTAYTPIAAPITTTASFGVPVAAAPVSYGVAAPAVQYTSAPIYSSVSTPIYGTSTVGAQYTVAAPVTVGAQYTVAAPVAVSTPYTVATAPVAAVTVRAGGQGAVTAVRAGGQTAAAPALSAELQYYKDLGERQAAQRRRNSRVVREAAEDLSRTSLINRVVAGPNAAAPFFPLVRLSIQKDVADAYKSEKRIANRNAEDAYQRYQNDPSRLNLLVSKYQDLNADLRDAAYQYNVINSGTFGQRIASSGLFGGIGGGLLGGIGITQIITQRQQAEDLEDIQRQMQRVQRQLQIEAQAQARAVQAGASAGAQQGSVQQRMMAMNVYGPQRG